MIYKYLLFGLFFLPTTLIAASDQLLEKLLSSPSHKQISLLENFGYKCGDRLPTVCNKNTLQITVDESTTFTPCEALRLCGKPSQRHLKTAMRGEPRAISELIITSQRPVQRWHCIAASANRNRLCIALNDGA